MSHFYQALCHPLDLWIQIIIYLCIESVEVNAEVQTPIFLSDQHNHVTPRALARAYCTCLQHLPHMCLHFYHWLGNLSEPFLECSSSVTFITCHAGSVQPNSHESREKILWYSTSSQQAATLLLGVQESRLIKSSCSKSISLCCSTVIFGLPVWIPWAAPNHSTIPGST